MSSGFDANAQDRFADLPLSCPLDGLALRRIEGGLVCEQGHSYDIARQGYVNLLPVQFKSSRDPGDSKSMVSARRAVMEQGHFSHLADAVCEKVLALAGFPECSPDGIPRCLVDAGCGEGYYTDQLARYLARTHPHAAGCVLGIDISKWAIQAAARTYSTLAFAVASNKQLPVLAGSAHVITSIFGFATWPAWAQLQTAGQWVFVIDAGPQHLVELRQQIYPDVRIHDAPPDHEAIAAGYAREDHEAVTCTRTLESHETIRNILEMTPHGRKASQGLLDKLAKTDTMNVTIEAVIRTYRRQ